MATLAEPVYTLSKSSGKVVEFKGYNVRGDIDDGEMRYMKNLTADEYPAIYQRGLRGYYEDAPEFETFYDEDGMAYDHEYPVSMMVKSHMNGSQDKKLAVIDNHGHFYYDGKDYYDAEKLNLTPNTKMVAINTKICFFPQKKYFRLVIDDTESDADRIGNIESIYRSVDATSGTSVKISGDTSLNFDASTLTIDGVDFGEYFSPGDSLSVKFNNVGLYTWLYWQKGNEAGDDYAGILYMAELSYNPTDVDGTVTLESDIYAIGGYGEDTLTQGDNLGYVDVWEQLSTDSGFKSRIATCTSILDKDVVASCSYIDSSGNGQADTLVLYGYDGEPISMHWDGATDKYDYGDATLDGLLLDGHIQSISTVTYDANAIEDVSAMVSAVNTNSITFTDNTFYSKAGSQITSATIKVRSISIERSCPDLDYVFEYGNRIWGTSNKDNTIYACKLGDPTNWTYYQDTALDSYYAEQGSDGEWTGIGQYNTHLLFFKEDCIHKLYGSYPSEYQVVTTYCNGVEKGSHRSITYLNGTLMYLSRVGVMGYSGGLPSVASACFGNTKYKNGVACSEGRRYILCAEKVNKDSNANKVYDVMIYDSDYQLWHRQDGTHINDFAVLDGKVLYSSPDDTHIVIMHADEPTEGEDIHWVAQLGAYDEYVEDKKVYSKFRMRYKLKEGSWFKVYISIDDGDWELAQTIEYDKNDRSRSVQIIPRRCDCFAIRLEGKGYCKIKSMVREFRQSTYKKENT